MILLIEQVTNKVKQIENLLESSKVPFVLWSPDRHLRPPLATYSHIIIGGGTLYVEEIDNPQSFLYQERLFLERYLNDCAVLGICLGAEILAKMTGNQITSSDRQQGLKEIFLTESGKEDALLGNLLCLKFYFNHRRRIVPSLANLEILAQDQEGSLAAFRIKETKAWGVQFHPENSPQGNILIQNFLQTT